MFKTLAFFALISTAINDQNAVEDPSTLPTYTGQYRQQTDFYFLNVPRAIDQTCDKVQATKDTQNADRFVLYPVSDYGRQDIKVGDEFKIQSVSNGEFFVVQQPSGIGAEIMYGDESKATVFQITFKHSRCALMYSRLGPDQSLLKNIDEGCHTFGLRVPALKGNTICLYHNGNVLVKSCGYYFYEVTLQ
jgi:hypothetical protein